MGLGLASGSAHPGFGVRDQVIEVDATGLDQSLDATAGQNGISQAQGFSEATNCTGIVLAKLDGTAKGGVIIPIRQKFKLPVKFIGVGEKVDDLAVFDPKEFVNGLFS